MTTSPRTAPRVKLLRFGVLNSPGVVHGVTFRDDDLNLSYAVADDPTRVTANRDALCAAFGIPLDDVVCARQAHGSNVARVGKAHRGRGARSCEDAVPDVDALISDTPDVYLLLLLADCVPILLHDPVHDAVGAAHAGWRGTAAGIAARTVVAMGDEFGSDPADLRAAIGPAIGRCCYEVSDDVAAAVQASAHAAPLIELGPRGRPHVDLPAANRAQLLAAGLRASNLEHAGICTSCAVDRFFSHRAEAGRAGRMAALIGLRG